jgi:zinc D-Ala-D-Ala carboxypeptidase
MPRILRALAIAPVLVGCAAVASPAPAASEAPSIASAPTIAGPERVARPAQSRPSEPAMVARLRPPLVADHCTDRDLLAPAVDDPVHAILDRSYGLAADDAPPDLVHASTAGFPGASGARMVREVLVDDLAAMRTALEAAGLSIQIDSAYRTHDDQAATFADWAVRIGPVAAASRTARPGHSEHQLGTAIDVTSPGWSGRFGDWAVESAEGAWMAAHAWEYGFVMSYPADGQAETCYGYEPWHYRWIGRSAAAAHRDSGLTLRRFLERYLGE